MTRQTNPVDTINGNKALAHTESMLTRNRGGQSSVGVLTNASSHKKSNGDDNDGDGDDNNEDKKNLNLNLSRSLPTIRLPNKKMLSKKMLSLPFVAASASYTKSTLHLVAGAIIGLYILNQSHLLPATLSGIVSKALFWPTLPITLFKRIGKWSTIVDDTVAIGVAPFFKVPDRLYEDYGVRGVINMCQEYGGPLKAYNRLGIEQLHLPTIDHVEPSFEDMKAAVKFIAEYESQNKGRVYVHCKAGHGRSAAIVYAWLLYKSPDLSVVNMKELNKQLCKQRNVRKSLWEQSNIKKFRSWLQLGRK